MGVLANHVPSIEQLKPGVVEIIEESGPSKRFFRTYRNGSFPETRRREAYASCLLQFPAASPSSSPSRP